MTRNRPTGLDTPRAPLNPPPTRAELSGDLVRLAVGTGDPARLAANWMPGRSLGEVLDDPREVDDTPLRNMRALAVRVPRLAKRH